MPHLRLTNIPKFLNFDDEDYAADGGGNPAFTPMDARELLNIRTSISYAASDHASTFVKGNVEVVYNLGSARHRCIAKKEDRKNAAVIYFLWASDGNHKIMRYHRNRVDAANPYGIIEKVVEYPFQWKQHQKITGIDLVQDNDRDLLYWTDNIGPRKINITKASLLDKVKSWDFYLPKTKIVGVSTRVTIQLRTRSGAVPVLPGGLSANYVYIIPSFANDDEGNDDALDFLATSINSNVQSAIEADACDCHLKLTTKYAEVERVNITFQLVPTNVTIPTLVVPDNWYGVDLMDRMFDQGKYPPPSNPLPTFKQDASINYNNVKNTVWQFRNIYNYDDYERSVTGVVSLIPIDNVVCNPVLNKRLNYIDIDFNDPELLDPRVLTILKEVSVCFRITNEGIWNEVERVKICDFFDINENNLAVTHYKFYNNIAPKPIADEDIEHQYDRLPVTSVAQKFIENRLVHAGITESMSPPDCVDLKLTPNIADDPTPETYEVTFRIRVLSTLLDDDAAAESDKSTFPQTKEARGPIMHNKGRATLDFPFFGGLHFGTDSPETHLTSGMEDKYQQNLPEGGWLCYAANTDFGGISKQINVGLPTTKDGALIIGEAGTTKGELWLRIGEYLDDAASPLRDLYSEVKIRVPNGRYIFRLASHWCSFGDKLQKGRMYDLNNGRLCHKTSTNVWGVKRNGGATWSPASEIVVSVQGADIFGGEFIVRDLSNVEQPDFRPPWTPICGYLYDAIGSVDEEEVRRNGIPVHRAFVSAQEAATDAALAAGSSRRSCFTDHNGYFFMSVDEGDDYTLRAWQVNSVLNLASATLIAFAQMSDLPGWPVFDVRAGTSLFKMPRSLQDLPDAQLQGAPEDLNQSALNQFLLCTHSDTARKNCSTIVAAKFVDSNGVPVEGVSVLLEGGGQGFTDENGEVRIVAWGDMIGPFTNQPENNNNRISILYYSLPAHCGATFTVPFFPINISAFGANPGVSGPPYSPTAIYDLTNNILIYGTSMVVTFQSPIIIKSRKRRGSYLGGMIYYDDLLRQTTVVFSDDSKVYIPFITEDLSKYITGLPAGTYKRGPAQIQWNIGHQPPKQATRYQLVLVREKTTSDYLTWVINDVKYIISGETITQNNVSTFEYVESRFGNTDANMIMLDISNITAYAKKNFDTRIGYTFTKGDMVRLIADDTTTGLQGLFEYEIISFQQPSFLVIRNLHSLAEIKPGSVIQIVKPKSQTTEELYFEMGECFRCTAPGTDNNQHLVTSGQFGSGDTYWRNRSIPVLNDDRNIYALYEYFMECNSISDFYDSTDEDIGRPQAANNYARELYRPALRRHSGAYVPNTKINNLCRWKESDYNELDREDGLIVDMKAIGNILQCTQQNAIISTYIGRIEMKNADGSSNLISSKDFFGTNNRLQQDYGAEFADGIAQWNDFVYAVATNKGLSWRRANNGVFPISEYKARSYFNRFKTMNVWDIASVVDRLNKQYIVTIWEKVFTETTVLSIANTTGEIFLQDILDVHIGDSVQITYFDRTTNSNVTVFVTVSQEPLSATSLFFNNGDGKLIVGDTLRVGIRGSAQTIAFSEPDNRWNMQLSMTPEAWESLGDETVMWQDGRLWIHEKNPLRNNFFGVQYPARVSTIVNANQEVKIWLALFIDSTQDNAGNNWHLPVVSNKNGQLSRISNQSFVKKEQYWHSEFYRDLNTVGVTNPIVNGRFMRSSALLLQLENDYTGEVLLRSINTLIEISERNVK